MTSLAEARNEMARIAAEALRRGRAQRRRKSKCRGRLESSHD